MDYSTGQAAKALSVSVTAVITWTRQFEDYLSDHTRPPKGQSRRYTADDLLILSTVATLRKQGVDLADIPGRLDDGERMEPVNSPINDEKQEEDNIPNVVSETAITAFSAALVTQENQINKLQNKVDELTDRLINAEKAAAAANAELSVLKQITERQADPKPEEERPLTFWQRLFGVGS